MGPKTPIPAIQIIPRIMAMGVVLYAQLVLKGHYLGGPDIIR